MFICAFVEAVQQQVFYISILTRYLLGSGAEGGGRSAYPKFGPYPELLPSLQRPLGPRLDQWTSLCAV